METSDLTQLIMESPELLSVLFDALPCGVIVVDENRLIQAANRRFEDAMGLSPGAVIGSCEGAAIGCLNATTDHSHDLDKLSLSCECCEARLLAVGALESNSIQEGRAHLKINAGGRVEDVTLSLTAAPFRVGKKRFAAVIIEDVHRLRGLRSSKEESSTLGMVGTHPQMEELFDTIRQVGPLDVPVLIQGESGTGKELVANALHAQSRRNRGLLVPVNCGALPDGLLESELFGHVRGAFTGALRDKKGRFHLADEGTIFLDEIGELSPQMQVKFLRVLQNGTFDRLGDERTIEVDTRVICATNRDLETEVDTGRFRADLYYRLCVVPITVPPLRHRTSDVPALAEHFLRPISEEAGRDIRGFTDDALECLAHHRWPGNVRELENAVRFAVIKAQGVPIQPRHLPPHVQNHDFIQPKQPKRTKLDLSVVRNAINVTNGNKSKAARHLGVSRATLYRFLSEHPLT